MLPSTHARRVFTHAALQLSSWRLLIDKVDEPYSMEEAVWLISAHTNLGDIEKADSLLIKYSNLDIATRKDLEGKIAIKKMMRNQ